MGKVTHPGKVSLSYGKEILLFSKCLVILLTRQLQTADVKWFGWKSNWNFDKVLQRLR